MSLFCGHIDQHLDVEVCMYIVYIYKSIHINNCAYRCSCSACMLVRCYIAYCFNCWLMLSYLCEVSMTFVCVAICAIVLHRVFARPLLVCGLVQSLPWVHDVYINAWVIDC